RHPRICTRSLHDALPISVLERGGRVETFVLHPHLGADAFAEPIRLDQRCPTFAEGHGRGGFGDIEQTPILLDNALPLVSGVIHSHCPSTRITDLTAWTTARSMSRSTVFL